MSRQITTEIEIMPQGRPRTASNDPWWFPGEIVHAIASWMGYEECWRCEMRRRAMNRWMRNRIGDANWR